MHPIKCSWIVNNVYYKSLISINNNISAGPIPEFLSIASDTDITQVVKIRILVSNHVHRQHHETV